MDSQARFEERMRALRDGFVAGLPERLATMRAALRADDRATLQHEAHRLAGTGVSYGLAAADVVGPRGRAARSRAARRWPALDADLEALSALIASALSRVELTG